MTSHEDDQALDEMLEWMVQCMKQQHHSKLEPFEQYAARIKQQMHGDLKKFKTRFKRGYNILIEEIKKS